MSDQFTQAMLKARHSTLLLMALAFGACSEASPSVSAEPGRVEFSTSTLNLGGERTTGITVRNTGGMAVGPVVLSVAPISGPGGVSLPGAALLVFPPEIPTLNPGEERSLNALIDLGGTVNPGTYGTSIAARVADVGDGTGPAESRITISFDVADFESVSGVTSVQIVPPATPVRRGDAAQISVQVTGESGVMEGVPIGWSVTPDDGAFIGENGQLVPYGTGPIEVIARVGTLADTVSLTATERDWSGTIVQVGEGAQVNRATSDLWLHGDYAYLGTHVGGAGGNAMFAWDISDPMSPLMTDSVIVDARVVNDVKVRADGRLAVITHEGSNDGLNGITLLDLDDPAHPTAVGRYTTGLETGVHNAWIDGNYVYLVADGSGVGLRILDISAPANPVPVASFVGSNTTFLHDVYVRDGLAFLSNWNEGLIVLDVGNGMAGGTPTNPIEVSRLQVRGGQTHNAWYWPEAGYVFVGEEDFSSPGVMHVVDFRDPANPAEVATFALPGDTPHNFWLDESQGVLYMAWYGQGLRALDVNGELLGDLDRQGREVAQIQHLGQGGCDLGETCTWAPQLHRGLIFLTDIPNGLTVLDPVF
ncbi:MAG: hypothetical protein ACR2QM_06520 [Longimicrobiales bacterium]